MEKSETRVPWFELDRMILTFIGADGYQSTAYVIKRVGKECERRNWKTSETEILKRIFQLRKSGTIAAVGKLWQWRSQYSQLSQSLFD
jgi:hypothetical protein